MSIRTTRPVLNADDLGFIIEGLMTVRQEYAKTATVAAKAGEHQQAGEQLAVGVEVDELIQRLQGLRDDIINAIVAEMVAEMGLRDGLDDDGLPTSEDIPMPTDEVGTVPMDAFMRDESDEAEPA